MGRVVLDITQSVDGFIAGPDISEQQPLGLNGHRLHEWLFDGQTTADAQLLQQLVQNTGAILLGHHTYRTAIADAWDGQTPFAAPALVVCHEAPAIQVHGFHYMTNGIHTALQQAQEIAGEKDVWLMGGANLVQQYLQLGLVDALHLHIAPLLLGSGTPLFTPAQFPSVTLHKRLHVASPAATHLYYDITR